LADPDSVYSDFGELLRSRRKAAGITQEQFADATGLSRTSISNIESGRQRILLHQLFGFARILGISAHDLLPTTPVTGQTEIDLDSELLKDLSEDQKEFLSRVTRSSG